MIADSPKIGQVYRDAYPVNGRKRRLKVVALLSGLVSSNPERYGVTEVLCDVYEPRKRRPSTMNEFSAHRFNRKHARGYVRVK